MMPRAVPNTFTSKVYTGVAGACSGCPGVYNRLAEFLCLDADTMRNRWSTAIHEYAHYIQDELETISDSAWCVACSCSAWIEGSADALAISILHGIYSRTFT
jgi:hypothetical protein